MQYLTPEGLIKYVQSIVTDENLLIGIGGRGSAGKTEFLRKLFNSVDEGWDIIWTDSFVKDIDYRRNIGVTGAHPESLDIDKLIGTMKNIKQGQEFDRPALYDHNKESFKEFPRTNAYKPKKYNIVEGIGAFFEPLMKHYDMTIFFECEQKEELNRRIQRDVHVRLRPLDDIITAFEIRRGQFEKYITPQRDRCDIVVRSEQDYRLKLMKKPEGYSFLAY